MWSVGRSRDDYFGLAGFGRLIIAGVNLPCRVEVDDEGARFTCRTSAEEELLKQLSPETREVVENYRYEPGTLEDFTRADFEQLFETLESGEFVPIPDEDALRQLKQVAESRNIPARQVNDMFRVVTKSMSCRTSGRIPIIRIRAFICR